MTSANPGAVIVGVGRSGTGYIKQQCNVIVGHLIQRVNDLGRHRLLLPSKLGQGQALGCCIDPCTECLDTPVEGRLLTRFRVPKYLGVLFVEFALASLEVSPVLAWVLAPLQFLQCLVCRLLFGTLIAGPP